MSGATSTDPTTSPTSTSPTSTQPTTSPTATSPTGGGYSATITRTSYGIPHIVAADSAAKAGTATYRLVPVTRGVSEDGYTEVHLPAAEQGKPLRFVTGGAYALLGKLKNAEEEE